MILHAIASMAISQLNSLIDKPKINEVTLDELGK
jgi:hypothetical protein